MDRDPGRLRYRLLALLQTIGGLLVLSFAVFPTPTTRPEVDIVIGIASLLLALVTWTVLPRVGTWATHGGVAASTVLTGLLVYLMATDQGQVFSSYGFAMTGAFAATFFALRGVLGHLALIVVMWLGACLLNPLIAAAIIPVTIAVLLVLLSLAFHVVTQRARESAERLDAVWQSQIDPSLLLDAVRGPGGEVIDLECIEANTAAAEALRTERARLVGQRIRSLGAGTPEADLLGRLIATLETGEPLILRSHPLLGDALKRFFDVRAFRAGSSVVLTWSDVTERARAEADLDRRARHDDLTGFLNRRTGLEHLAARLADRRGGALALLFCDLDYFKDVNDTHGHETGDEVLRVTADRVRSVLRHDDVVVRAGGDEFLVLLEGVPSPEVPLALAEKIRAAVEQPLLVHVGELRVGVSIGVIEVHPGESVDEVVARADQAMYDAKHQGRGRVVSA